MKLATNSLTAGISEQPVADFMRNFTLEITPRSASKIDNFRNHLQPGTWVYVTALADADFSETAALCKKLYQQGMCPVPHIAARSIRNSQQLENDLSHLTSEAGVARLLVIAGANKKPVGNFENSMQLLDTGLFDKYRIESIGLAGHPEGSPDMSDNAIAKSLTWKNSFAERTDARMYLVTQFCFAAQPVIDWANRINSAGNRLPIIVGIPGLATLKSLMSHAKACGIGPSIKVLMKQAKNAHKLFSLHAPDRLVSELASYASRNAACGIEGVHAFPLGGFANTAQWCYALTRGELPSHPLD